MRARHAILATVLTATLGVGVGTAWAQSTDESDSIGYDARLWHPNYDGSGLFTTYGANTIEPGRFMVGATVDYADSPIVLKASGGGFAPVVTSSTTFELGAGVGIHDRFDASLALPFQTHTVLNPYGSDRQGGIALNGIGDIRLAGKFRVLSPEGVMPGVAVLAEFILPSGDGRSWLGGGAFQPALLAIVQEEIGPVSLFANAGYRLRPETEEIWGTFVDDAFIYRVGGRFDTGFQKLSVLGEAGGLIHTGGGPAPAELGLGLERPITDDIGLAVGGNIGLNEALGTPVWRVFGRFTWALGRPRAAPGVPPTIVSPPDPNPEVAPLSANVEAEPDPDPAPAETLDPAAPIANPILIEPTDIVIKEKVIELNQKIHFEHNSAKVSQASYPLLNAVATTIREHQELTEIRIEGHTDSTGTAVFNRVLSVRRARAVRRYLIEQGVDSDRLRATGFGESRPIASNQSDEGRLENRRVEFRIRERTGETPPDEPEEAAPSGGGNAP